MENNSTTTRKWYQFPLVWLVISIPVASVIMGMLFLTLAIRSKDSLVVDDYYKQGKTINRVLARDETARKMGVYASFQYTRSQNQLLLQLHLKNQQYPSTIKLLFSHPTRKKQDRLILMNHLGAGKYTAPSPKLIDGRWYIQLETATWRLLATITLPVKQAIRLNPAKL